jgi:SAM-dependent methyltransferase
MGLLSFLKEKKSEPLDAPAATLEHREILLRKPFLKKIYEEWYRSFIDIAGDLPEGKLLEIGSGGGFLKDLLPEVVTSDILALPHCDLTFSAERIPFDNESVSGIFMIDVLHHIPDCEQFFGEAKRVLVPGGEIFMIEPANTAWARLIYKNLHHEPFDPEREEWRFDTEGPLSGANGALPWMVFERDLDKFKEKFPSLELLGIKVHTPFRYLLTGGLSYKSMVPGFSFKAVSLLEKPFSSLGMFQTIRIRNARKPDFTR